MRTTLWLALAVLSSACVETVLPDSGSGGGAGGGSGGGGGAAVNCPTPTGTGTTHATSDLTVDETWTAAGSPHLVTTTVRLRGTANLTIEPCAEVRLDPGVGIAVGFQRNGSGRLTAEGLPSKPITFKRNGATAWGAIMVTSSVAMPASLSLANVTLEGGGNSPGLSNYGGATIIGVGAGALPLVKLIALKDVTIRGSQGVGLSLLQYLGLTDTSANLTITGSGAQPLWIGTPALHSIPTGSYTGNAKDEVLIDRTFDVDPTDTMHDRGIPYLVPNVNSNGYLRVAPAQATGTATLVIEPGVTVKVGKNGYFWIGQGSSAAQTNRAAIIANGTAAKPIKFTSAEPVPAAGDWVGFAYKALSAENSIQYATIEYAGAACLCSGWGCTPAQQNSALLFYGWAPASAFITNTTFKDIAGNAILSGWTTSGPDLTPTNSFVNVAGCKQTNYPDSTNSCTGKPPCLVP